MLKQCIGFTDLAAENIEIVYRRKRLWDCIEEIKGDKYLSKFLILD